MHACMHACMYVCVCVWQSCVWKMVCVKVTWVRHECRHLCSLALQCHPPGKRNMNLICKRFSAPVAGAWAKHARKTNIPKQADERNVPEHKTCQRRSYVNMPAHKHEFDVHRVFCMLQSLLLELNRPEKQTCQNRPETQIGKHTGTRNMNFDVHRVFCSSRFYLN